MSSLSLPGYRPQWQGLPAHLQHRLGVWMTIAGPRSENDVYGFNTALHVGDCPIQVLRRRHHLAEHLGVSVVWLSQVHGVDCLDVSDVPLSFSDSLTADAAFSMRPGQAVGVMTADCLPVLLVNHKGSAVAAAHCGWRGLLNGVLENTVRRLRQSCDNSKVDCHDGCDQIYACFGAAIGPASFEVGAEVREAYLRKSDRYSTCFSPLSAQTLTSGKREDAKFLADLYGLAELTLSGLGAVTVSPCEKDTYSDPELFSFRRNPTTGRMVSLIWLKD